jgi:Tfp pilus assembly pilus retraction ATPase PilT
MIEITKGLEQNLVSPPSSGTLSSLVAEGATDICFCVAALRGDEPRVVAMPGAWFRRGGAAGRVMRLFGTLEIDLANVSAALRASIEKEVNIRFQNRDLALTDGGMRLRISIRALASGPSPCFQVFLRVLPLAIPDPERTGSAAFLERFPACQSGIFLVAGVAGSGKTTFLASIVRRYLATHPIHVVSIEDPIEYLFSDSGDATDAAFPGVVSQREVGTDVPSFAEGLRLALREMPDVILVGEIRDMATAEAAISAAETGHMVLSTIHAPTNVGVIDRFLGIFDFAPSAALRLSQCLLGTVHLAPLRIRDGSGILRADPSFLWCYGEDHRNVRVAIREGKTHTLEAQGDIAARNERQRVSGQIPPHSRTKG